MSPTSPNLGASRGDPPWRNQITKPPNRSTLWISLIILALSLLSLISCAGGFLWLFSKSYQSNPVIQLALDRAQSDPITLQRLGQPLQLGHLVKGFINSSGPAGDANLSIPIHGPLSRAQMSITAVKLDNQWQLTSLSLTFVDDSPPHVIIKSPN